MKKLILPASPVSFLSLVLLLFAFSTISYAQQPAQDKTAAKTPLEQSPLPADFITDGCTMWFNFGAFRNCCVQHDLDYYNKQGWRARLQADNSLFMCVSSKSIQYKVTAPLMWAGVRVFGSPWFPIHRKRVYAVKKPNN